MPRYYITCQMEYHCRWTYTWVAFGLSCKTLVWVAPFANLRLAIYTMLIACPICMVLLLVELDNRHTIHLHLVQLTIIIIDLYTCKSMLSFGELLSFGPNLNRGIGCIELSVQTCKSRVATCFCSPQYPLINRVAWCVVCINWITAISGALCTAFGAVLCSLVCQLVVAKIIPPHSMRVRATGP